MKRMVSLILALLMMLSVCALTVFADAVSGRVLTDGETLSPGSRVSAWGTPTIDGTRDDTVYQRWGSARSTLDEYGSGAAFEIWFANDGDYLYYWLNVTLPAGENDKMVLDKNDLTRLYIDFLNTHTQVYKATENEYQKQYFASGAKEYHGGQFQYTPSTSGVAGSRGANLGIGSVANGDVAFDIHYSDAEKSNVSDYVIEARVILPDYVKSAIAANKQPVIGVGYEVRNNASDPKYKLSYVDSAIAEPNVDGKLKYFSWIWADYTVAPDLVLSNGSDTNRTDFGLRVENVADVTGKTVTVDGSMGAGEGWNGLPYYLLDKTTPDGKTIGDPVTGKASALWISADEEYIYLYYETCNTDWKWLYFLLAFDPTLTTNKSDLFVEYRIGLLKDTDKNDSNAFRAKNGNGTFGANDDYFSKADYCLTATDEKKTVEMRIPVPQAATDGRVQGDYEIRIGLLERTSDANNGGVVTSNGFDWSVAKNPLVLPSVNDPEAKDLPEWIENSKQNANFDSLKELTVNVFGDSYFAGNGLPKAQVWPALLATKYGWNYLNYGVNGNMLSGFGDADEMPMYKRYRQMSNNSPNLVILDGGRNDYNHNVPIGTIDSEDTNTFMGAMNVMMKGLRKKFPNAAMVFTTVWNFPDTNSESTLTYLDYAKATEEVCEKWGVYCFKAYDPATSGVDMRSEEFRAKYCMFPNDISHLNLSGMKLVMPNFEKYLDACMTDWAENKDAILDRVAANTGNQEKPGTTDSETDENTGSSEPAVTTGKPSGSKPADKKGCRSEIGFGTLLAMLVITALAAVFRSFAGKKKKTAR